MGLNIKRIFFYQVASSSAVCVCGEFGDSCGGHVPWDVQERIPPRAADPGNVRGLLPHRAHHVYRGEHRFDLCHVLTFAITTVADVGLVFFNPPSMTDQSLVSEVIRWLSAYTGHWWSFAVLPSNLFLSAVYEISPVFLLVKGEPWHENVTRSWTVRWNHVNIWLQQERQAEEVFLAAHSYRVVMQPSLWNVWGFIYDDLLLKQWRSRWALLWRAGKAGVKLLCCYFGTSNHERFIFFIIRFSFRHTSLNLKGLPLTP